MVVTIRSFRPLIEIIDFLVDIYKANSMVTNRYYKICDRYSSLCQWVLKIALYTLLAMCVFMLFAPVIEYHVNGNVTPAAGIYLPGVVEYDINTLSILVIYNWLMILMGLCIEIPLVILVYLIFANIHMLSQIMVFEIGELNNIANNCNGFDNITVIHNQLVNLIHMRTKYNELSCNVFSFPRKSPFT